MSLTALYYDDRWTKSNSVYQLLGRCVSRRDNHCISEPHLTMETNETLEWIYISCFLKCIQSVTSWKWDSRHSAAATLQKIEGKQQTIQAQQKPLPELVTGKNATEKVSNPRGLRRQPHCGEGGALWWNRIDRQRLRLYVWPSVLCSTSLQSCRLFTLKFDGGPS